MRICLVYDCLFPHTVGGAERWYRSLAEKLAQAGHEVSYLTLRQWPKGEVPAVAGVEVIAVGPRMSLYTASGRRRMLPPLVFGAGVLWHLLRRGRRYDVVHTGSFPYFSLLAAALVRPLARFALFVDWHEVWTRRYWHEYLGAPLGSIGWAVQAICARVPQRAFCFSRLSGERLRVEGLRGEQITLPGLYAGEPAGPCAGLSVNVGQPVGPLVLFAGRHIPEKRVLAIPPAVARLREEIPGIRAVILGDGPQRQALQLAIDRLELGGVVEAPGFVSGERVGELMSRAMCMLLPSRREGYGMVVIEAAAAGTPSVVVAGPDNAAVELIEEGRNGFVVRSAEAVDLAAAILRVWHGGASLRAKTASWFATHHERLGIEASLQVVVESYRSSATSSLPSARR